ncbi:MAG: hypothetical protein AB7T49_10140 [Oligoflexales bacterium]
MKFLKSTLLGLAVAANAFAGETSIETTATRILVLENHLISFQSEEYATKKEAITKDLTLIFDQKLTDEGKKAFSLPPSAALGEIIIGTSDEYEAVLAPLFPQGSTTLVITPVVDLGNDAIKALVQKYKATSLEKLFDKAYILHYSQYENPFVVAKEFGEVSALKYAEANSMLGMGAFDVSKTAEGDYVFTIGWGDCPAGCIASNSTYFTVDSTTGTVSKGSQEGNPIPDEEYYKYFLRTEN